MLRLLVARTAQEMLKFRDRWEHCTSSRTGIFQTFMWAHMAAIVFAAVERPFIVMSEDDAGLAIIPAAVGMGRRAIGLLGERLFDYRDVLHSGDATILRRAWSEAAAARMPLSFAALKGDELRQHWESFAPKAFSTAPAVLRSSTTAERFLASHSRLGRQARRIRKRGAELRRYDGSASQMIRWIYERKGEQPQGEVFAEPLRREFMVRIAAAKPGACDIFTYETQTAVVAALVTFRHLSTRHFYTIYFNPAWAHHSPGQVLVYEATGISLAEDLDCDYMTGEYPYKTRLATDSIPLYKVDASPARMAQIAAGCEDLVPLAA